MSTRRERMREAQRTARKKSLEPSKGWRAVKHGKPERKLVAFKAGEIVPRNAEYVTFAVKGNTPHFFFLVPPPEKKRQTAKIGFKLT